MCAEKRALSPNVLTERSILKKYEKPIWHRFIGACKDYRLVEAGDKIAVCISGGKDSFLLAKCLQLLQRHSDVPFELVFLGMDPGYNAENRARITENATKLEIPLEIFESDIFSVTAEQQKGSPCYLCARMRRGYLYKEAQKRGCNKIALGHHFDDVIETTLMSMLYGAECKTMVPKIHSQNYAGMQLIRPLVYVHEADIRAWVRYNNLSFIACACRFTENDPPEAAGHGARNEVKQLIAGLRSVNPQADINLFRAMENVNLNMVYGYTQNGQAHDFLQLFSQEIEEKASTSIPEKKTEKVPPKTNDPEE